ncbi:F-box protein [Melia azedarach]|uniref:F-box protein n=1 Tax=Melia azedarach TaxID=155640 RepID=A0ACC1YMY8_MELAZ|nr:F-box protein [Melia azedarach]
MHFRVITSTSPLNPNCMVLATHLDALELFFCRPGDNKWTRICGDLQRRLGPYYCNDTIFYEDEFYVVDRIAELFRIDFGLSSAVKLTLERTYTTLFNYLVELNGDLLLVTRPKNVVTPPAGTRSITTHGEHFGDPLYYRTTVFRIFKMDWHEGKWVFDKIKNIGNNAILLGKHSSSSFPVDGGIANFQANCIYFIDDCEVTDRSKLPDIGAYNLETQRIEWLYEHSTVWTSPLNWFRVH